MLFCLAFLVELSPPGVMDVVVGGLTGAALVVVGLLASSRCRTLVPRRNAQHARLAVLSLGAGVAAGAVVLGAELGLATVDPGIEAQSSLSL